MKPPYELPGCCIGSACNKAGLSVKQLLLLGIIAGIYISLGAFLVIAVTRDLAPVIGVGLTSFVSGAIFPVGLILIVLAGGELFTGNCLMPVAWVARRITLKAVARNWAWVYAANFAGALLLAVALYYCGLLQGSFAARALEIATMKANLSFSEVFFRAILCNWLVALAVWLAGGASGVADKVLVVWIPIMAFVTGSFEHCIANMFFFSAGLLAGFNAGSDMPAGLDVGACLANLGSATLGNIVGALLMVGMLYYSTYHKPENKAGG